MNVLRSSLTRKMCSSSALRLQRSFSETVRVLGVESSCDDTCAAIVTNEGNILASVQQSQHKLNKQNRGVIPSVAAKQHSTALPLVVEGALHAAGISSIEKDIDAVALTIGPGLAPCLGAGLSFTQSFCKVHKKPLILVNHMEAHAMAPTMHHCVFYPCLGFMVSGGNTEVVYIPDHLHPFQVVGETVDDACGECIDKVYRCISELGLDVVHSDGLKHGGALISALADEYNKVENKQPLSFPLPMARQRTADFSFAGLKTFSIRMLQRMKTDGDWTGPAIIRFCFYFEQAVIRHLLHKLGFAVSLFPEAHYIVMSCLRCEE